MNSKTTKTIILKAAIMVSLFYIWHINITNAQFKSASYSEQNNVETDYWIKPELTLIEDTNNFEYDTSETMPIKWQIKSYDEPDDISYEVLVKVTGTENFYKYATVSNETFIELTDTKIRELANITDNEQDLSFVVKVTATDSHNLTDTVISKPYTYLAEDDDDSDNKQKDEEDDTKDAQSPPDITQLQDSSTEPIFETTEIPVTEPIETPVIESTSSIAPTPETEDTSVMPEITEEATQSAE